MYGDTEAIRGLARGLRRLGDDIRWEADTLLARAEAVPWQGIAADAMRCVAGSRVGALRRTADLHDEAAAALDDHADAVDRVKRLIAAIEDRVLAMVAAARDRIAGVLGVVGGLIDPVDDLLDRFVPPPSGHRDWLSVDLPGLDLPGLPDVDVPFLGAGRMSDDPAVILEVSGGSHGLEASYAAMRALADTYDDAGDRMRGMARDGGRAAVDADLLESAVLSPGTAIRAEGAIVAATTGPDGVLVESAGWEVDAVAIRGSVSLLEAADEARHDAFEVLDHLVGRQLGMALSLGAPALVTGVPLAVAVGGDGLVDLLENLVTGNPTLIEHLVNGGGGLLAGLSGGLLPTFTTNDAADELGDLYPEGDPVVDHLETGAGEQPSSVEDLLAHLAAVAALSQGADSPANGTIEIQTITTADGQVVHIVNLPGTDDLATMPWTADEDVRDMGTNLDLVAGEPDDYQQGILEAMAEAGIGADEPVLIVGHSQGGMEAVAIAAGETGFTVTDVVTAGSPTAQVGQLPEGVNVLSIEQHGDLVPLLDGEPNPPAVEQTTVVVDADPGQGIATHHDHDVYVAGGAAVDSSDHPSVVSSVDSLHEHGFLGSDGQVTSQLFQITRAP